MSKLVLDLGDNNIYDEGATAISEGIRVLARLSKLVLNLERNHIGSKGAEALGIGIRELQGVARRGQLTLDLRDNIIFDEGARRRCTVLTK